ncbi:Uncharacterised protein [Vibrio cholerae]|nr:Uncharacterised protein [Vibrio cholerae]
MYKVISSSMQSYNHTHTLGGKITPHNLDRDPK